MINVKQNKMYRCLILLTISSTLGLEAWLTLFNNFAVEIVGLEGSHIGIIQSKWLIMVLYVLDQVFYNFHIAIQTYFQKIGDPRDIASSISVSFTINHIAAVVLPAIGGALWMIDYRIPFIGGAVFSFVSLMAVQRIQTQR